MTASSATPWPQTSLALLLQAKISNCFSTISNCSYFSFYVVRRLLQVRSVHLRTKRMHRKKIEHFCCQRYVDGTKHLQGGLLSWFFFDMSKLKGNVHPHIAVTVCMALAVSHEINLMAVVRQGREWHIHVMTRLTTTLNAFCNSWVVSHYYANGGQCSAVAELTTRCRWLDWWSVASCRSLERKAKSQGLILAEHWHGHLAKEALKVW